ncbi:MAG TPA: ABC transporter ATP-binding protein [Bacteroidales bacterium]|nr:ABC transporter ATP-binding protein [Bacteroidales bacterium]
MIEVSGLHKSFGRNTVLKGIDLVLPAGNVTAVLGPNGSGKTTLLKSILGMVLPDKGDIRVLGRSIHHQWEYRQAIGYLPQIARFPENLTVQELIRMVMDLRRQRADEGPLLALFDLEHFLKKRLRYLSGGTRQKINVMLAFLFDHQIMILDEPTAGLDPLAVLHLKELIRNERQKGKTICLTTHILPLVDDIADRVVYLLEGNVYFEGTIGQLKEKYKGGNTESAIGRMLQPEKYD